LTYPMSGEGGWIAPLVAAWVGSFAVAALLSETVVVAIIGFSAGAVPSLLAYLGSRRAARLDQVSLEGTMIAQAIDRAKDESRERLEERRRTMSQEEVSDMLRTALRLVIDALEEVVPHHPAIANARAVLARAAELAHREVEHGQSGWQASVGAAGPDRAGGQISEQPPL
jgi:hypothetical protein